MRGLVDFETEHWLSLCGIADCSDPFVPCYEIQKQLIRKALASPFSEKSLRPLCVCVWSLCISVTLIVTHCFRILLNLLLTTNFSSCHFWIWLVRVLLMGSWVSPPPVRWFSVFWCDWVKPPGKTLQPCLSRKRQKCCRDLCHNSSVITYSLEMSV